MMYDHKITEADSIQKMLNIIYAQVKQKKK